MYKITVSQRDISAFLNERIRSMSDDHGGLLAPLLSSHL